ncbi:conserved protein, unknown function [Plasmodium sp. gorilla clade G2]|uniref:conserved protein, unknown function n=1 Tax=Plasmodium sp. gorilla clade G2 TaxID=880535 RepID=UPI000D2159BC|nr:conserved protein, unknown function [Plasmodium sp. gorilla clade G2]SOV19856.1 conserved protein, unknown function [Plasmodium sp. gorilla clade G2]
MIKKRKLKIDSKCKRIPTEKDDELKIEEDNRKNSKEGKIEERHHNDEKNFINLESSKKLKVLQQMRMKKKGISTDNLNYETKVIEKHDNEKKLLDKHFTKNITEKEIEEAHIESFIKENMTEFYEELNNKRKQQKDQDQETKKKQANNNNDLINDLYKLSDHLKIKSTFEDTSEKLNCITGITEVPIPLEVKMKNIEETEKYKRQILKNLHNMSKSKKGT